MATYWGAFETGSATGAATYADPVRYPANMPAGSAGDEFRWKANATLQTLGTGTWTFNSTTVTLPAGHGLSVGALISIGDGYWYQITVLSVNTATIHEIWITTTLTGAQSLTTYALVPVVLSAWSNANGTIGSTPGTSPSVRTKWSGGWDSETTQNGYTVVDFNNIVAYGFSFYQKAYLDITNFIFVNYGSNHLFSSQLGQGTRIYNNTFVRSRGSSAIYITSLSSVDGCDLLISGNKFINGGALWGYYAIRVYGAIDSNLNRAVITGNSGTVVGTAFIGLSYCSDSLVTNNTIYCKDSSYPAIYAAAGMNIRVIKNTIYDFPGTLYGAITVQACGYFYAAYNTIKNGATKIAYGLGGASKIIALYDTVDSNTLGEITSGAKESIRFIVANSLGVFIKTYRVGTITKQTAGDANFSLPPGQSFLLKYANNLAPTLTSGASKAGSNVPSYGYADALKEQGCSIYIPRAYSQIKFRTAVNSQLATLTNSQYWIEVESPDGTITKCDSDGACATQTSASDWTQYRTTDAINLAAAGHLKVNMFTTWYHASQMVGIGTLEISVDNGSTWIQLVQQWDGDTGGEPIWTLDANSPVAGNVLNGVVYDPLKYLTGTFDVPTIWITGLTETSTEITATGGGFLTGGNGHFEIDGIEITPDSITTSYMHGTK